MSSRREFITLLGGAAATWPLAARAQQPTLPVVGYLNGGSPRQDELGAFHKGLGELGFVERRNVTLEYRWADNEHSRLPDLASDLLRHGVTIIAAFGSGATLAAKAATATIPVVFLTGADAVEGGVVTNLSRPGGNVTGISSMNVGVGLGLKRLGLLHELVPRVMRFGVLVQSNLSSSVLRLTVAEAQEAAAAIGRPLEVLSAGTNREIDAVFASLAQKQVDAVMVSPTYLFNDRRIQLAMSGVRYGVPMIFPDRRDAEIGGLMSYGPDYTGLNRQVGVYIGRILKGEKPGELPVQQPTKFEMIINARTARLMGIEVPATLLATADEVIE
jgi:putative ABC transport system substrate-binding protein